MPLLPKRCERGTVFLEIVIAVGILAVLLHAIASLVIASYDVLGFSRTRITARHLANERMEFIRNLPYENVAVQGGIPAGNLPQLETVSRNGLNYKVRTNVIYVDDPFDGLAPTDLLPTDYKRARVDVSWTGTFASDSTVTLVSDIAPKGIETTGEGGTLSILVFDANAVPVTQAQVRIQNSVVDPIIDLTVDTDTNGKVLLPGTPPCFECYQIDVSKEGYSNDRTYSSTEVAHPEKPLATVNDQSVTEITFAIDKTSSLTVTSTQGRDNNYAPLTNQFFQLTGSKIIGTDTEEAPVYKYNQLLQTDASGRVVVNDLEWDVYTLTVPAGGWDLSGSNPMSPFAVLPNTSLELSFSSVSHEDNSILFKVKESSGSAIAKAYIRLTKPGGYDATILTGDEGLPDFGQAFFSPLETATYDVEATKSGYLDNFFEATASGALEEIVILNGQ